MTDSSCVALSVGLFGINQRSWQVMEVLFNMYGRGRFRIAENEPPSVAVVDMDGPDAEREWDQFRDRYPALPTVLISVSTVTKPGTTSLKKPVKTQELLDVLSNLTRSAPQGNTDRPPETRPASTAAPSAPAAPPTNPAAVCPSVSRTAGITPAKASARAATDAMEEDLLEETLIACEDVDLHDPKKVQSIYFDPSDRFLAVCQEAIKQVMQTGTSHGIFLCGMKHPLYFTMQNGGEVVTLLPLANLRALSLTHLRAANCTVSELTSLPSTMEGMRRLRFDVFLWEVALYTSRGHLPAGTPLDAPVKLKLWPNFTRLRESPNAMSVAALWTSKAFSLKEICATLGVPQCHVFAFYCAADAAGLIDTTIPAPPGDKPLGVEFRGELDRRAPNADARGKPPGGVERRGLLSRILSHLMSA
jgi:hypothetical protein